MRLLPALLAAPFLLAACGQAPDPERPPAAPVATDAARHVPTRAQVEAFLAEGPEPGLRKLAVADYWLHYKMMQATGIERELGGEPQAAAALQALGDAFERKLRGAEADLPRLVPAAFTGEGMASGFMGLGMGNMAGMMTGGMMSSGVSRMSDAQLADLVKAGPISFGSGDGKGELRIGEDGSLAQSMEFEVNERGVNGKVKLKTRMDACPDAEGKVTVTLQTESRMSVSGKPGTGGSVHSEFRYERWLDDDAHLIDGADGGASELRIRMGGIEDFQSQHVEITTGYARDGTPIFRNHEEGGYSIFRPDEVARTQDLLRGAQLLQTLVAEAMLRGMGAGTSPWESGRCVELKVTSDPVKRKGIRPNTAFDLEARPRAKADGAPAGGTVTATLDGGSSLQPATGKVPADAKYGYAGPAGKNEKASIAFEARSRRGVGKATLGFDTSETAYRIKGGQNDFFANVVVCSLTRPFDIRSTAGIVMHMSGGESGGSWTQSGKAAGVAWSGGGSYTLSAAEDGGAWLTAKGTATISTPMGRYSDSVEPTFSVTPVEEACE